MDTMENKSEKIESPAIILRDHLAIDRTRLANRRTLLAFVRTGLYFVVTCLGIWKFGEEKWLIWVGGLFLGLGLFLIILGVVSYLKMRKKILRGYDD